VGTNLYKAGLSGRDDSFFAPCVLPLVPELWDMTGLSAVTVAGDGTCGRWRPSSSMLSLVLGLFSPLHIAGRLGRAVGRFCPPPRIGLNSHVPVQASSFGPVLLRLLPFKFLTEICDFIAKYGKAAPLPSCSDWPSPFGWNPLRRPRFAAR